MYSSPADPHGVTERYTLVDRFLLDWDLNNATYYSPTLPCILPSEQLTYQMKVTVSLLIRRLQAMITPYDLMVIIIDGLIGAIVARLL